jgi:hypothetical protein
VLCSTLLVRSGLLRFLVSASSCQTTGCKPAAEPLAMPKASGGAVGPALAALFLVLVADGVHTSAIIEASSPPLHAMGLGVVALDEARYAVECAHAFDRSGRPRNGALPRP